MEFTTQSFIEFTKLSQQGDVIPESIASGGAQTGDLLWIVLLALAAIFFVASVAYKCVQRKKTTQQGVVSSSAGKLLSSIGIILAAVCLMFSVISATSHISKANADGISSTNIQIQVNENTGEMKFCEAKLVNETSNELQTKTVSMEYLEPGLEKAVWNIDFDNNNVYKGTVPGIQSSEYKLNKETTIKTNAEGINPDVAKSLIGKRVASVNITVKENEIPDTYEIVPAPRNIEYGKGKFDLNQKVNIVCPSTIDDATKNHLNKALTNHDIDYEYSDAPKEGEQNIVLGIDSSMTHNDEHVINITENTINLTGKDSDAVFMGVTTLNDVLDKVTNKRIQCLKIQDYADGKIRGFIEGFYGPPWTKENRLDLMEFGSKFKMNNYIFAPKDDAYHSAQWRDPYPADKLAEIKDYVDKGTETKVKFTWAIHPFMHSPIRFDTEANYKADLQLIFNKYQQLYDIGVRNFGLSADDASGTTPQNQRRLTEDLDKWCRDKGDCANLVFVPQYYNEDSANSAEGQAYCAELAQAPQSVDIMWTGKHVKGHASTETFEYFKQKYNHEAFMWWNFPVNDYCANRLFMGKSEMLDDNVTNFKGIVSNPMCQAQASKPALYSLAIYTWNNASFNREKDWKDSFQYVDEATKDSIYEISKHMSYYYRAEEEMDWEESEEMKPVLDSATEKLNNNQKIGEDANTINDYLQKVVNAIEDLNANCGNKGLVDEMKEYNNCLSFVALADQQIVEAVTLVDQQKGEEAKAKVEEAKATFEKSKNGKEAGQKRLVPFFDVALNYCSRFLPEVVESYEINPNPINIEYHKDQFFGYRDEIGINSSNQIDQPTKDRLASILNAKGIKYKEVTNSTNTIFLGVDGDDSQAVKNLEAKGLIDKNIFNKIDGHIIDVDNNQITIVGKNTTAVFVGLATLKQVLNATNSPFIEGFTAKDYAQSEWRGFIEGYYGIPWSNENRMSLMDFGADFKMNSYIFAPKDDPYHSAQWRDAYPADKLALMKQLADKGTETKVDFTWAIHPFLHKAFDFDNYDADLKTITDKFEQLYSIGVRHFGLSADDISGDHPVSAENQKRVLLDLNKWCLDKGDVKKLVFVPECYQLGRGDDAKFNKYWEVMKETPDTIDMMWTGDHVMSHTSQSTFDTFKKVSNHEAYMWWNYPVNDYCKNHLLMGKAEMLDPGTKGFIGLVSNPMQQAQASKVALFSTANYVWNTDNFDAQAVVDKGYKYVDPGAPEALKEICKHLCYSSSSDDMDFEESENMKQDLDDATAKLNAEQPLGELNLKLTQEYQTIREALQQFDRTHTNKGLYEEMAPWLYSLNYECKASIGALDAIKKLEAGDLSGAKAAYSQAKSEFDRSKTYEVPVLDGQNKVYAEPGCKRLIPFANTMLNYLEKHTKYFAKYEIYPAPHSLSYSDAASVFDATVNLVLTNGLDDSTKAKAKKVLTDNGITYTESTEITSGQNIIVGVNDEGDAVKAYFEAKGIYDSEIYTKTDGHQVNVSNNILAVLGKDTTASFYGLSTVDLILNQIENKSITDLDIKDYSDAELRGFIEGYYGIPWSKENKESLMEFGSKFKMNDYIFAPKNDPYHSSQWRDLYPADKLAEIQDYVVTSKATKVQFTWSIHPFQHSPFDFNNYDADLKTITDKFDQLYNIGVRRFGLMADDATGTTPENMVKLLNDINAWRESKGDVEKITFCPRVFSEYWIRLEGQPAITYLNVIGQGLSPDNFNIMWTGPSVCSHCTFDSNKKFNEYTMGNFKPFIWMNWSVNDYCRDHLVMGKAEMLEDGVDNFSGMVSNPMQQAQCSKVALFAVANYTWNRAGFNRDNTWHDSFKYIDKDVGDALNTLAWHLQYSNADEYMDFNESENIGEDLVEVTYKLDNDLSIAENKDYLKFKFDEINTAAKKVKTNCQNQLLLDEMSPWLDSFDEFSQSLSLSISAIDAYQNGKIDEAKQLYTQANDLYALSRTHKVPNIDPADIFATCGAKKLMPFSNKMLEYLKAKL